MFGWLAGWSIVGWMVTREFNAGKSFSQMIGSLLLLVKLVVWIVGLLVDSSLPIFCDWIDSIFNCKLILLFFSLSDW